ncbi:terminase gpA endonuclease subunit, partial [Streptococcus pseudopneumoniae]|uniref:terminase gpA endonuclease subunit n=1 Tax=Streptococcus pseudopneumoniae TaxID=257758 RepID=UPI00202F6F3E
MADGVREFLEAQGDPSRLRVWVNTYLGETWEEEGQRVDTHSLMQRCEEYDSRVPEGVTLLTAGADVQDDRVEVEVIGW